MLPEWESVQKKIIFYRVKLGLNKKEMAEALQLSPVSYFQKERGEVRFSDEQKVQLVEKLREVEPHLTVGELFFGEGRRMMVVHETAEGNEDELANMLKMFRNYEGGNENGNL